MPYILKTRALTKIKGGRELVKNVNLNVKKGTIYGFLGPNGAGKTTVMKLLTNLWKPTGGEIEIFGKPLTPKSYELLGKMGSIIEFPVFYEHMSGYENLALHCEYMGYYKDGSIGEALALLGLEGSAKKPVSEYSLGMKERLGIARAIVTKPELLILDEPTNGLDPSGMKEICALLKNLCVEYEVTVIISSHILSRIESIADTVGIINHGRMAREISMAEIERDNFSYIELSALNIKRAAYVLNEKLKTSAFKISADGKIRIYDSQLGLDKISAAMAEDGAGVTELVRKSESLEDYYLKVTEE